ncbi:Uncharacterized protein CTYZ_00003215, partial [Cryptosporidium tyzzeri]
AFVA